jgi:hypothetical protein
MKIFNPSGLQDVSRILVYYFGMPFSFRTFLALSCVALLTGCGDPDTGGNPEPEQDPNLKCRENAENAMRATLANANTALSDAASRIDFTYMLERPDGKSFTYNYGASTSQTRYESASTSKMISAAIILRQVDAHRLSLTDHPQQYITTIPNTQVPGWPISPSEGLYGLTLSQLLSFTSGLVTEHSCLYSDSPSSGSPPFTFEGCVLAIALKNTGNGKTPGQEFSYSGSNLQVAGLMAVEAAGMASWQEVFTEFKTQTGLFPTSTYDFPSTQNPALAGGMHWTGEEYMAFLRALSHGTLLSSNMLSQMLTDQTASTTRGASPIYSRLGFDWHYGFGLWHECDNPVYNCVPGTRVSSPGAFGAYPFWDRSKGYFGIVARQEQIGHFENGILIERSVRSLAESWAACTY